MLVNDPKSHRTLTFEGVGTEWEVEQITNLKRFDEETGELLERDEWEYETEGSDEIEGGCEYEYLKIFLTNNDTGERVCLNETKTFEELGIEVIGLDYCLEQMDKEGFGNCTNTGACEAHCPKEISLDNIKMLNREYIKSKITQ